MNDLKIATKLASCFTILVCALLLVGGISLFNQGRLNQSTRELGIERRQKLEAAAAINTAMSDYRIAEANHVLAGEKAALDLASKDLAVAAKTIADNVDFLEPRINVPSARVALRNFKEEWSRYQDSSHEVQRLKLAGKNEEAATRFRALRGDFETANGAAVSMQDAQSKVMNERAMAAQALYDSSRRLTLGVLIVVAALAVAMLIVLIRSIARPVTSVTSALGQLASGDMTADVTLAERRDEVGALVGALRRLRDQLAAADRAKAEQTALIVDSIGSGLDALAKGDLTARVDAELAGPFAKLKGDFNAAMAAMQSAMLKMRTSSRSIDSGAGEIRQASDDLSHRTEQQAASLEQTAAAMDEITSSVKKAAEGAGRARDIVSLTHREAESSGEIVQRTVAAMSGIERTSAEIADIITVIDGIAFQTNLLALNAGVEAARAGDAGKGFAVVASEVRALAQRSADAAKDVKARIAASTEQVELGVELVDATGKALQNIIGRVAEINILVGDIAVAAQQQATGLQQVNTAVGEMDSVTQQNAAMVEQATASARTLAGEADGMSREVGRFRLEDGHADAERDMPTANVHRLRPTPSRPVPAAPRKAIVARGATAAAPAQDDWSEF